MKKIFTGLLLSALAGIFFLLNTENEIVKKEKRTSHPQAAEETKAARDEYFHKILRDPATDRIPVNMRSRELEFYTKNKFEFFQLAKGTGVGGFRIKEAGPTDVGGRTRALAVSSDGKYVLAGGVTGGIWKSTDNGASWKLKNTTSQMLSVTCIVQDPRPGKEHIWYYGTGEYRGSSGVSGQKYYTGGVIMKSTDHGETWSEVPSTVPSSVTGWFSSNITFVSNIKISPVTGSIFVSANGGYLFKAQGDTDDFKKIGGSRNDHYFVDVDVAKDGKILVAYSEYGYNKYWSSSKKPSATATPGIYISSDDGKNWKNITPAAMPLKYWRTLVYFAPSNPKVAYVLTHEGIRKRDENHFYKLNIADGTSEDRSANLPNWTSYEKGYINTQRSYNYVLSVKPDDENFVIVGGTNLFKSPNGFASKPNNVIISSTWIGGYIIDTGSSKSYPNHHADQHSIAFNPLNPKITWSGHDGGISWTNDITNALQVSWNNKNNGYNVTQFYTISIPPTAGDNRIVGGTQDNGSPYFSFDGSKASNSVDISSGDGAFCYWGKEDVFVSSQNGKTRRLGLAENGGNPPDIFNVGGRDWDEITPKTADSKHFINPFTVDPNDERYVYYITEHELWRNNDVVNIGVNSYNKAPTLENWTKLNTISGEEYTAVAVSNRNSSNVLYVGISSSGKPKIARYDNSKTAATAAALTTISGADAGSNIQRIAVNPENSNEIIVILSNYRVKSIWYSNDAGTTFTDIEGNLSGNEGPSVRSATIINTEKGKFYFVGTSIGLYAANSLNGNLTKWQQYGKDIIGSAIVSDLTSRVADDKLAIATHGRGIFVGNYDADYVVGVNPTTPSGYSLKQNYPNPFNPSTKIGFEIAEETKVKIEIFNIAGKLVEVLTNKMYPAGKHKITWNASGFATGMYIYRITTSDFTKSKKMLYIK